MKIDPHVHCRDGLEDFKETIAHVFRLCDEQGVSMIFDMPNTNPPVLTEIGVEQRMALTPKTARDRYRLFMGVTTDPEQLRQAVALVRQHPAVVGLKLYAGQSVGSLSVPSESAQQMIYRTLTEYGYDGVLAVHCEKESLFQGVFDPTQPSSHSTMRSPESEAESIRDQIKFARAAAFRGTLHICHISSIAALEALRAARATPAAGLRLTCGVTPHHLLWASPHLQGPAGLLYKVNPPLRNPSDNIALRKALKQGEIDWIESDHAPHPICEKLYPPYASGFPSLCLYRNLIEEVLPFWGLTEEMIEKITYVNIRKTFKME